MTADKWARINRLSTILSRREIRGEVGGDKRKPVDSGR